MRIHSKKVERINLMIGTAGHVDHGKTELVKMLTGCETDRLKEEKERGLSINLGFAPCFLKTRRMVGLVDVPGHEKFIRNMVAGATGIDLVLLVVAADDGVMPQTREHLDILQLLGLRAGLVAITKIDLVDPEMVELVREDTRNLLRGTFLEGAPMVPVSSITGEGLEELIQTLTDLVERMPKRDVSGVFRLPVERTFTVAGYGTVATGIAASGRVRLGDVVEVLPSRQRGRVRGLQVFQMEEEEARAGECIALNVADVEYRALERGHVLATPGYFQPQESLVMRLHYLPSAPRPLKSGWQVRFHTGTSEACGEVWLLGQNTLSPGESGLAHLRLEAPLVVSPGDRYILRLHSPLLTVGGGQIIGEAPRKLRRLRPETIAAAKAREEALESPMALVDYLVRQTGAQPLPQEAIARQAKLPADQMAEVVENLSAEGRIVCLRPGERLLHAAALDSLQSQALAHLEAFHQAHPLREGLDRIALREALHLEAAVYEEVLRRLAASGKVVVVNGRVKCAHFTVQLTEAQAELLGKLESIYREARFSTPRPEELDLPAPAAEVAALLTLLQERGVLVELGEHVFFHREAVEEAWNRLVRYVQKQGAILTTEYRDLLGTTKKYAVALLDHFAATGLTRRVGSQHFLR